MTVIISLWVLGTFLFSLNTMFGMTGRFNVEHEEEVGLRLGIVIVLTALIMWSFMVVIPLAVTKYALLYVL
jgi:hypothetical protein